MVETFEAKEKKIGSIRIVKNPNFPSGTSLQAYVKTNRAELRKVFGNPNMGESGDGKSKGKEWNLIVGPHRVTIYDYREKGKKGTKYFNIGGSGKYGALLVAQALSIHRNERVYAKETVPKWLEDKGHHQQVKSIDEHPDLTYERAKEYEDNRRRYRAETDLGFKEWADQEMKTHGKKESFDDWLDDELKSHGDDITLQDWGHHELDSHYERYGSEGFRTIGGMGFQIEFKNGYTISIMFGDSSYGDHYNNPDFDYENSKEFLESSQAEVAIRKPNGQIMLDVLGWVSPDFVAALIPVVATGDEAEIIEVIQNREHREAEDLNWGGDPKGQLATALRNARIKAKQPKKPLKIEKLDAEMVWGHSMDFREHKPKAIPHIGGGAKYNGYFAIKGYEGDTKDGFRYRIFKDPYDKKEWYDANVYDVQGMMEDRRKNSRLNPRFNSSSITVGSFPTLEQAKRALVFRMIQDEQYYHRLTDGELDWLMRGTKIYNRKWKKAETSGQWEIGEQLEEAQMNAETFEGIPQSVSDLEAVEDVRCDKYEMEVNFENEDMVIVSGEELKAIMDDGWDLDSVRSFEGAGMSLLFTRNPNRAFRAEGKRKVCQDSHLDGIDFLEWSEEAEGPNCYITGLPNPEGDIEGEDNICEPCRSKWIYEDGPKGEGYYRASVYYDAEDQNKDLLKWIEDYLWDNDKKGYQAYHAHRKSLGLNAEGKKRKKISGVMSDPFDELSLDSGGIKKGIVALAAVGLTIFGINKLRK